MAPAPTGYEGSKEPEPSVIMGPVIVYDRVLDFNARYNRVIQSSNLLAIF